MKQFQAKIESPEYNDLNKVIWWFIIIRWITCVGVFIALVLVYFTLQYSLPYKILFILIFILFNVNLIFTIYYILIKNRNLSRRELIIYFNFQITSDYILLFLLIYFTGFLENPFSYFFIFHIILTSLIFSPLTVFIYEGILSSSIIVVTFLEYYRIIPHYFLIKANFNIYHDFIFIRCAGLISTLIISSYLITAIKKRKKEHGRRVEIELNHYKNLDKVKSSFILQVTHELREPIAALKGFHEMINRGIAGEISQKVKELIDKANHRTENLLTIIDEMIDYAYMKTSEEIQYQKVLLDIKEVINSNIEVVRNMAASKKIKFIFNCPRNLTFLSNRDLLNIIFNNLLTNAIKYSPEKSNITINAEKEGEQIHFLIKDEGIGIDELELQKVFEEFYRTKKARQIEKDGTGLGLSIVKKAVESLNGRISVYSEVNVGTSFHIYFPFEGKESTG